MYSDLFGRLFLIGGLSCFATMFCGFGGQSINLGEHSERKLSQMIRYNIKKNE
jgi:hypothetical protein